MQFVRQMVYDPVLRLIHAWNGVLIVVLLGSGELAVHFRLEWSVAGLWQMHIWLGYGLLLGFVARLVWGFVGPGRACWPGLWQPTAWRAGLHRDGSRTWLALPADGRVPPMAALVYLVVYGAVFAMLVTGLVLAAINKGVGPLYDWLGFYFEIGEPFRETHEFLKNTLWAFLVLHVLAMIWHERRDGVPIAQGMISGFHYHPVTETDAQVSDPVEPSP